MSASAAKGHLLPPLLREAWPRHTAKRVALAADVPLETARNWVRGRAAPSAELFLRLADTSGGFADAIERLLDARRAARLDGANAAADRSLGAGARGAAAVRE